ncbi:Chitin synthase, class 5 [Ascosphaera acerosa]|nr:Chitin synthase, class 5 [Ascosphaera acerosa]
MLVSLTVGKVDAGVAVLLTEDNRLSRPSVQIEFPSVLLPRNITSGSIVNINVSRNFAAEEASVAGFKRLQDTILTKYGLHSPSAPVLRLRNATQTSIVLTWDPLDLATASLRSLALYRNDSKAGNIPRPFETQSTKISGLAIDTEYTFHLVLRTSAGTYSSQKLKCRTHKMTDLSGITVTTGVMPPAVRESLGQALERIGGKLVSNVRIDTTHFVCTEAGGEKWEKAVKQNIPVVRPEWVDGCEREGTLVGVRGYYLDADPKMRQIGPNVRRQSSLAEPAQRPQQQQQHSPSSASHSSPATATATAAEAAATQPAGNDASLPPTPHSASRSANAAPKTAESQSESATQPVQHAHAAQHSPPQSSNEVAADGGRGDKDRQTHQAAASPTPPAYDQVHEQEHEREPEHATATTDANGDSNPTANTQASGAASDSDSSRDREQEHTHETREHTSASSETAPAESNSAMQSSPYSSEPPQEPPLPQQSSTDTVEQEKEKETAPQQRSLPVREKSDQAQDDSESGLEEVPL